jgi:hypothetical protein
MNMPLLLRLTGRFPTSYGRALRETAPSPDEAAPDNWPGWVRPGKREGLRIRPGQAESCSEPRVNFVPYPNSELDETFASNSR